MSEFVCRTLKLLAESKGAFASAIKNIFNTRTMATLKVSDLSVGDWVRYRENICTIDSIYPAANGFPDEVALLSKNVYLGVRYVSELQSIPITPEILEANGFVKNGEYNEWSIGDWDGIPFIGISLSRQSMRIKYLGTDIFLENKEVYVHQLQHALRLAGIDKEINL